MPRPIYAISISIIALALAGCCRESFREMAMASIKQKPDQERRLSAQKSRAVSRSAAASATASRSDSAAAHAIETGSVEKRQDCQGEHLAYQATREYLKSVGPKPPSAEGEEGPCTRDGAN